MPQGPRAVLSCASVRECPLSKNGSSWAGELPDPIDTAFMDSDLRLAFSGGAIYAEGPAPAESFFGHYDGSVPEGIRSGAALSRFSDGSQAEAVLAAIDADGGGFRLTSGLQDLSLGV
jgi:hypothetical protein